MTRNRVVLVIDDEVQIRRFLRAGFELEDFSVLEAENAASGLRAATLRPIDLIIVDLGLPDLDGGDRGAGALLVDVPIIVLSVRSSEEEKVRLLELGADDYVVKPFGMAELLARARAALRRHSRGADGETSASTVGPLPIDLAARACHRGGSGCSSSPKEYRLLQVLAQHAGNVVTHQHPSEGSMGRQAICTMRITCAFSCASCARRSRRIRPSRAFCSPNWASATGWRRTNWLRIERLACLCRIYAAAQV